MAIEVLGNTTHGTFEELIEQIRKLHDEYEVLSISVSFKKPRKPLIRLITNRDDFQPPTTTSEGK